MQRAAYVLSAIGDNMKEEGFDLVGNTTAFRRGNDIHLDRGRHGTVRRRGHNRRRGAFVIFDQS